MVLRTKELPTLKRTIKVDGTVWTSLKNMKKENETFNDVILELLNKRTISQGNNNIKAIKYGRRTAFLEIQGFSQEVMGVKFEYNDIKSQQADFTLDLTIKEIYYGKQIFNPSIFFGVDNQHKHFNSAYIRTYLLCVHLALQKEFRIKDVFHATEFEQIAKWRKLYYEYTLSEESFIHDIKQVLADSEEEKPTQEDRNRIDHSISMRIMGRPQ